MASLLTLLRDPQRAGVYQTTLDAEEIVAAAKTLDLPAYKLNVGKARGKSGLLEHFAKVLRFPDYFGNNWDALNDCLTDLSWLDAKGWVLILLNGNRFARDNQAAFDTAVEVLNSAADHWRGQKKPFWVFIQAQAGWDLDLPKIVSD